MTTSSTPAGAVSYSDTLFLPKTEFPMRLAQDQDAQMRSALGHDNGYHAPDDPTFTLHDGPPYANGALHPGHVLNKVLKDFTSRTAQASGHRVDFRPGWDCHGLPVEWNVEKEWTEQGKDKKADTVAFRQACRAYAQHWVSHQKDSFKTLAVAADWSNPYLTMDYAFESGVAKAFLSMVDKGFVYAAKRPMLWSSVEHTVLAEAELEHLPFKSTAAWVLYPVKEGAFPQNTALMAWTTTPWTLTVSAGLAYGALAYGLYEVTQSQGWVKDGTYLVLAQDAKDRAEKALRATLAFVETVSTDTLHTTRVHHPLHNVHPHWAQHLPCVEADFVDTETGSGLVHLAPAHGPDDFTLGQQKNLTTTDALTAHGTLTDMPLFGGLSVFENNKPGPATDAVLQTLLDACTLAGRHTHSHTYPHSWRSRTPVVYRLTNQWFLGLDKTPTGVSTPDHATTLRAQSLSALDRVTFHPEGAKERLRSMVATRPDWVLSRQRAWGVPLPLFLHTKKTFDDPDYVLRNAAVDARVLEAFTKEGADCWYHPDAKARFLGDDADPALYTQCMDVLDVWFESGCSHHLALKRPADVYLEGTDQHRGWFQASLVCAMALGNGVPFKSLYTHGFTLDGKGQKMSKSLGNTVDPNTLLTTHGVDCVRLWVALSDSTQDMKLGQEGLNNAKDVYRKLRNTLRFLLGALQDHTAVPTKRLWDNPALTQPQMPAAKPKLHTLNQAKDVALRETLWVHPDGFTAFDALDTWVLNKLHHTNTLVQDAYCTMHFSKAVSLVHQFCTQTLSALYCDMRKDTLYCDTEHHPKRQATLNTLSLAFDTLLSWLAPVTPLLVQEVALLRYQRTVTPRFLALDGFSEDSEHMGTLLMLRHDLYRELETWTPKPGPLSLAVCVTNMPYDTDMLRTVLGVGYVNKKDTPETQPTASLTQVFKEKCPRCWTGQEHALLCHRCSSVMHQTGTEA